MMQKFHYILKRIIWTNGCFDVIHVGHIELFKYARAQGDSLYVGIDSDSRVKKLKGQERPINNQNFRKEVLEAIKYIDRVFIFDSPDQMEQILRENEISLIVVGDEYREKHVTGSQICQVDFFKKIQNFSTTLMIDSKKDI